MTDHFEYSDACGMQPCRDALVSAEDGAKAVLCSGSIGGAAGLAELSSAILGGMSAGLSPAKAACAASAAIPAGAILSFAGYSVSGGKLYAASAGDARLYLFRKGRMIFHTDDDSSAYELFMRHEAAYSGLRMLPGRSELKTGLTCKAFAHSYTLELCEGDAVLMCSDGFWEYIYETEMELDLIKSDCSERWLRYMLLRLTHRSMLMGDSLSAVCFIYQGEK